MKYNIGVEIECELLSPHNRNWLIGDYHCNNVCLPSSKMWFVEYDGSLYPTKSGICCEIISKVSHSKTIFKNRLTKFKKAVSNNGMYELKDCINFNRTMGTHIHFSLPERNILCTKIPRQSLKKLGNYFKKKIKDSDIESKDSILNHYSRRYARNLSHNTRRARYCEFNINSDFDGRGIEWRSPNMKDLKTWREFDTFFDIILDSLDYFFTTLYKAEIKQSIHVKIDETQTTVADELHIPLDADSNFVIDVDVTVDNNINITESLNDSTILNSIGHWASPDIRDCDDGYYFE